MLLFLKCVKYMEALQVTYLFYNNILSLFYIIFVGANNLISSSSFHTHYLEDQLNLIFHMGEHRMCRWNLLHLCNFHNLTNQNHRGCGFASLIFDHF